QAAINRAEGEAAATIAIAKATAEALRQIAEATQSPGGMDAVNLKVAQQYVEAFANVAKQSNTVLLPSNMSDMGSMIASAMSIMRNTDPKALPKNLPEVPPNP
ncbi:MAG: band-7 C-terminal domain-containing protein, partial [Candidatus Aphodousia sp.]|nr:band-7 C-terminal domain-containing protein [Candidatus Aphodousia sp.]